MNKIKYFIIYLKKNKFVFLFFCSSFKEVYMKIYRDLSLMVKYETFNLWYVGSNPIGLKFNVLNVDN